MDPRTSLSPEPTRAHGLDPRTPVIVGAAQEIQRPGDWTDPADARGPIELMLDAARAAAADAGTPSLLTRLDWVAVAGGWWRYRDPGRLVAKHLGSEPAGTAITALSGSGPQELMGEAAARIARGELDLAIVLGGEARWSHRRITRDGGEPTWIDETGDADPTERLSEIPSELIDEARFFGGAAPVYALFDEALRVVRGESVDDHIAGISALWQRFNRVAVGNPFAWDRTPMSAETIATPTADNRMIAWPYTKAMVANNTVDMASAVLVCSVEAARSARIPTERWVFPRVATTAHDTYRLANRRELHLAPAMTAAGRAALRLAEVTADELSRVDLYSCFPSIVQMSAEALGIDTDRPLTTTGGLGFAGAPVGNASGQAIAAMVPLLREDDGIGLVHANGGNATKHAFGVYATTPTRTGFRLVDSQPGTDLDPRPDAPRDLAGPATVEAATVIHDREGPTHALLSCLREDIRVFAKSSRPDLMAACTTGEIIGTSVHRDPSGFVD